MLTWKLYRRISLASVGTFLRTPLRLQDRTREILGTEHVLHAYIPDMTQRVLWRRRAGQKASDTLFYTTEERGEDGREVIREGPLVAQQILQHRLRICREPSSFWNPETLCMVPDKVDTAVWQYEHLRQVTQELNLLLVKLDEHCTKQTCPKMKATDEWLYLCAAHRTPQECCAVDYMVHTIDGTASLLNSSKWFPSRTSIPASSLKFFQSIARRLYRVFAHAYFHHREIYREFENETALCERFTHLITKFNLVPAKMQIITDPFSHDSNTVPETQSSTVQPTAVESVV